MKKLFKMLSAVLVLLLIFAMTACQNLNTGDDSGSSSEEISVNEISLSADKIPLSDVKNGTTASVTATASGTNFNKAESISMQLYDSDNNPYGNPVSVGESRISDDGRTFSAQIQVPDKDDEYTLKIQIKKSQEENAKTQSKTASIMVYSAPTFNSFLIPDVGIPYANGKEIIATVTGKNFTAPEVSEKSFNANWQTEDAQSIFKDSVTEINIIDYTRLTVTFTIPARTNPNTASGTSGESGQESAEGEKLLSAGQYKLQITYTDENQQAEGNAVSLEGTLNVKDTSKYSAGQIILSDDTTAEPNSYTAIDQSKPPVAVLFLNGNGIPYGVGLQTSSFVKWASRNSEGYSQEFKDIFCTPSATGTKAADNATFYGDLDGSDNWSAICKMDTEADAKKETDYPAFDWASKYGSTYKSQLGNATDGWYMPSLAELCSVYKNLAEINSSFALINGLENGSTYADSSLGEKLFWSSSQKSGDANRAWAVYFKNGSINANYKNSSNDCVLAIRAVKIN